MMGRGETRGTREDRNEEIPRKAFRLEGGQIDEK